MPTSWVERLALRLTAGLFAIPFVSIFLFECFGVRASWIHGILLGLVGLLYLGWKTWGPGPSKEKSDAPDPATHPFKFAPELVFVLGVATLLTCFIKYVESPYLEGRDPWEHVLGVRYLMDTGLLRQSLPEFPLIQYIDAYPPLYDLLLLLPASFCGLPALAAKAMNSLIVGLALPVFFLFALKLFGDTKRALAAVLLYAVLPGNLMRYIWGHSVALLFLFAGLYCVLRIKESWRWGIPGASFFCGILLAAPSAGIKAGGLLMLTAAVLLVLKRAWGIRVVAMGALALALSMTWYLPVFSRYGINPKKLTAAMGQLPKRRSDQRQRAKAASKAAPKAIPKVEAKAARPSSREDALEGYHAMAGKEGFWSGSEARRYSLWDFAFFRPYDYYLGVKKRRPLIMVAPHGLGVPVLILVVIFMGLLGIRVVRRLSPDPNHLLLMLWILFALVGVLGMHLGLVFFVWRFWMLLCPFAVLGAADALATLVENREGSTGKHFLLWSVYALTALAALGGLFFDFFKEPQPWFAFDEGYPFIFVMTLPVLWYMSAIKKVPNGTVLEWKWMAGIIGLHLLLAGPYRIHRLLQIVPDRIYGIPELEAPGYMNAYYKTEPNAKIWSMGGHFSLSAVVGLDRQFPLYDPEALGFSQQMLHDPDSVPPGALLDWLTQREYRYLIVDPAFQHFAFRKARRSEERFVGWMTALEQTGRVTLIREDRQGDQFFRFILYRIKHR